ncbi:MAG: rod shape-determining protein MreC [Anaerolineae bacterium]
MSRLRGTPGALLLLLFILAFLALEVTHLLEPVENVVAQLFFPLQRGLDSLGGRFTNLGRYLQDRETLRSQNEELQKLVDQLVIENVRLREAEIENITLRQQLGFKESNPDYQLVSAQVIGHDPSNVLEYITVDRGSGDGIAVGMPVVTSQGLVGRVVETYPRSSRVLLITDASSSVNALIQNSRATGVVQGKPGGGVVMRYIQQGEEVKVGDLVVTSGLGGNFPRRLVIGQVTAVRQKDIELFQEAEVEPTVEFDHLEMVMIITHFE